MTIHLTDATVDLFLDDLGPPFEIDDDIRDKEAFRQVVTAVLDGTAVIIFAKTPFGRRPLRVRWEQGEWSFSRSLMTQAVSFGTAEVCCPSYYPSGADDQNSDEVS